MKVTFTRLPSQEVTRVKVTFVLDSVKLQIFVYNIHSVLITAKCYTITIFFAITYSLLIIFNKDHRNIGLKGSLEVILSSTPLKVGLPRAPV